VAPVKFALDELTKLEALAIGALVSARRASSVVTAGQYREYKVAATNHEATLMRTLTTK
jgi:hypothetical protein